jgi:hypothetical protein
MRQVEEFEAGIWIIGWKSWFTNHYLSIDQQIQIEMWAMIFDNCRLPIADCRLPIAEIKIPSFRLLEV